MAPLVLLQSSDWHVGSPLTGRGLGLGEELRALRRREVDEAPQRLVRAAREAGPDAILLPGDLWDAGSVPPTLFRRLVEALEALAPVPVFVAPGNHDFAGPGGFYDDAFLDALGLPGWPGNVRVFRSSAWETAAVPGRDDATVTGRAFLSPLVDTGRPLAPPPARPPAELAILMLHGSLESYRGPDAPSGSKKTAPFSREELLGAGFDWTALGHHHRMEVVTREDGSPAGAYSGSPTGRGLDETGPRHFVKVTLEAGAPARVETLPADCRKVLDLELDAAGRDGEGLRDAALALLLEAGATPGDLVRLTVVGRSAPAIRTTQTLGDLKGLVAHLALRDRTLGDGEARPDRGTAEGRFVLDLESRLAATEDPRARRVLELAAVLGREALLGRVPAPPAEEDL
ncbi:MAG: DNA repair exonuclease [Thermoanaerobaculia bacterium]|nr:DNA repair exonuclease [Thermoanaerobaculia bacterium]